MNESRSPRERTVTKRVETNAKGGENVKVAGERLRLVSIRCTVQCGHLTPRRQPPFSHGGQRFNQFSINVLQAECIDFQLVGFPTEPTRRDLSIAGYPMVPSLYRYFFPFYSFPYWKSFFTYFSLLSSQYFTRSCNILFYEHFSAPRGSDGTPC